ncbi:hypothetical protein HJG53_11825 [Sphingomonas sp. ID1715]|uniref:hypothetical protein n=1 Tax=Sphingomonas sp. ID1715 TaxID=1656898 RepID=UPI0014888885|nr:hypothetical protein [Sphingomonas sp. ID1715]NNM77598.1 hypothetical protein [Sphingomonas sp. ID1715]
MRSLIGLLILAAAPALAADQPATAPEAAKEKLICKREVPIGSLIATRKICLTQTQWRKRTDDGNATARQLVEDGAGACGKDGGVCPF